MGLKDHTNRITKMRVRIVTCDPTTETIDVLDATKSIQRLTLFDVPAGFTWPVEGEDWSIYQEGNYWRLGHKFLNDEERLRFQALEPGQSYTTVEDDILFDERVDAKISLALEGIANDNGTTGDKNYVHVQGVPSAVWVANHDLGKFPSVTVIDSANQEVEGAVLHNSETQTTITFSAAFSGKALFN